MDDRVQRELPFAESEGSRAERKVLLGRALERIGCDLYESRLAEWIFAITDGGQRGELKQSYEKLAERPWGLCCSVRKARAVVEQLERHRVVSVERHRYISGGQDANSYRIDWDGIRELLWLPAIVPGGTACHGGGTACHGGGTACHGGGTACHPLIGIHTSLTPSWPAGRPEVVSKQENQITIAEASPSIGDWSAADRQLVVASLRSAGYDEQTSTRLARESETEFRLLPTDVVAVCQEFSHPANRPRFARAGAIGYRLRNGSWPVDGVVPLHVAQGREARRDDSRKVRESETELFMIVKQCRQAKVPDDEIRRRLRERLPEAVCVAAGW